MILLMQIAEQEYEKFYRLHMNENSVGNKKRVCRKILGVIGCHSACENAVIISCGQEEREMNFPVYLYFPLSLNFRQDLCAIEHLFSLPWCILLANKF